MSCQHTWETSGAQDGRDEKASSPHSLVCKRSTLLCCWKLRDTLFALVDLPPVLERLRVPEVLRARLLLSSRVVMLPVLPAAGRKKGRWNCNQKTTALAPKMRMARRQKKKRKKKRDEQLKTHLLPFLLQQQDSLAAHRPCPSPHRHNQTDRHSQTGWLPLEYHGVGASLQNRSPLQRECRTKSGRRTRAAAAAAAAALETCVL